MISSGMYTVDIVAEKSRKLQGNTVLDYFRRLTSAYFIECLTWVVIRTLYKGEN